MSAISGISGSSEDIRTNYLNLLVTQLRNQNPLEPMSNNEMASQLASISQLEHLESLDNTFHRALLAAQHNEAVALIGKEVIFLVPGQEDAFVGDVKAVDIVDGEALLRIGDYEVPLDAVRSISD